MGTQFSNLYTAVYSLSRRRQFAVSHSSPATFKVVHVWVTERKRPTDSNGLHVRLECT
jgi:hypothetical protein